MSVDKLVDSIQLDSDLTSVANAIRTKGETSEPLFFPDDFIDAIMAIPRVAERTVIGNIVNFNISSKAYLDSFVAQINPIQSLNGYDAPWGPGGNVNKLPPMVDGTYEGNGVRAIVENGVATLSGTTTASGNAIIIPLQGSYTFVGGEYLHLGNSEVGSWQPSFENASNPGGGVTATVSPANRIVQIASTKAGYEVTRIRFYLRNHVTLSGTFAPMICADNTARSFVPYSNICPITGFSDANIHVSPTIDPNDGTTYTINLNGVYYGGTLNVITRVLTITKANINSYAGETLPGEWISDRDVYAPGTTPTTGAQVVYDLATPQTVQLPPQQVTIIVGENNIWANTGNVTVKYAEIST